MQSFLDVKFKRDIKVAVVVACGSGSAIAVIVSNSTRHSIRGLRPGNVLFFFGFYSSTEVIIVHKAMFIQKKHRSTTHGSTISGTREKSRVSDYTYILGLRWSSMVSSKRTC